MKLGGGAGGAAKPKMKLGGRAGHGAKMGAASKGSTPKLHVGKGPHARGAPKTKATAPRGKTPAAHRGSAAAAPAMRPSPQPQRMAMDDRPGAGAKRGDDRRAREKRLANVSL
jgi:hypothetical protein